MSGWCGVPSTNCRGYVDRREVPELQLQHAAPIGPEKARAEGENEVEPLLGLCGLDRRPSAERDGVHGPAPGANLRAQVVLAHAPDVADGDVADEEERSWVAGTCRLQGAEGLDRRRMDELVGVDLQ